MFKNQVVYRNKNFDKSENWTHKILLNYMKKAGLDTLRCGRLLIYRIDETYILIKLTTLYGIHNISLSEVWQLARPSPESTIRLIGMETIRGI